MIESNLIDTTRGFIYIICGKSKKSMLEHLNMKSETYKVKLYTKMLEM
jgi:hypothetical protein